MSLQRTFVFLAVLSILPLLGMFSFVWRHWRPYQQSQERSGYRKAMSAIERRLLLDSNGSSSLLYATQALKASSAATEVLNVKGEKRTPSKVTSAKTGSDVTKFNVTSTLVLFIGYPRSGHTLISSLLDAHPHVAIANEYKLLHRWMDFSAKQRTRQYIFNELLNDSVRQSMFGYRSATVNHTFNYAVPNQWNGRYDKFLEIVGDKHGPQTTKFLEDPKHWSTVTEIEELLNVTVRFLHVIRNPLDNIATMAVRRQTNRTFIEQGKVLDNFDLLRQQMRTYFHLSEINSKLLTKLKVLNIYSEDLISNPKPVLSTLCRFLNLKCSPSYLSACSSIVFGSTSNTRSNVQWTQELKDLTYRYIDKHQFLRRYRSH